MKELQEIKRDKLEVQATAPEPRQIKFIGQLRPQKGQNCYQLHVATGEVTLAEFETTTVGYHETGKVNKKVIVKDGCIYNVAINKKTAQKKFIKQLINHIKNR